MKRECDVCGCSYVAKSPRSKTCGDACRQRLSRGAAKVARPSRSALTVGVGSDLVTVTRSTLEAAGRLDSVAGQQALRVAEAMVEPDTSSSVAALSKALSAVMAEALQNAVSAGDPLDELRARRDAKRAG